ncbi:MAG: 6-carboxytetrahydropterin synthase QueD [Planctomycetota bacterium]
MTVTKVFRFEAAHQLPDHPGKCRRLHGHGYRLEVTVGREVDPRTGMVLDFYDLKRIVEDRVVSRLDHRYLNDLLQPSTAENLCLWIARELAELPLVELRLWETATSCATWRRPGT